MISVTDLEEKSKRRRPKKNPSTKIGMDFLIRPKSPIIEKEEKPVEDVKKETQNEFQEEIRPIKVVDSKKTLEKKTKLAKKRIVKKVKKKDRAEKKSELDLGNAISIPSSGFTKVSNEILEFIFQSNLSGNEIKFLTLIIRESIGWGKDYCLLSKTDVKNKSTVSNSKIYSIRDSLAESGIISYGVDPSSGKNYYFLNKDFFFKGTENESSSIKKELPVSVKDVISSLVMSDKAKAREEEQAKSLLNQDISEDELLNLYKNITEEGTLQGEKCSRPFSYLNSGAIEGVRERSNGQGKPSINSELIWEAITSYNTRELLPDEMKERLSEADLDWINAHGGRLTLGQNQNLQRLLGLN